jgi:hypothetical protein
LQCAVAVFENGVSIGVVIRKRGPRSPRIREPTQAAEGKSLDQGFFEPLTRPSRLGVPRPAISDDMTELMAELVYLYRFPSLESSRADSRSSPLDARFCRGKVGLGRLVADAVARRRLCLESEGVNFDEAFRGLMRDTIRITSGHGGPD